MRYAAQLKKVRNHLKAQLPPGRWEVVSIDRVKRKAALVPVDWKFNTVPWQTCSDKHVVHWPGNALFGRELGLVVSGRPSPLRDGNER